MVLGRKFVHLPVLLKPDAVRRRVALCAAFFGAATARIAPAPATVSMPAAPRIAPEAYLAIGYPVLGPRAVRADVAERAHARLREASRDAPCRLPRELPSWLGCSRGTLAAVVRALGYEHDTAGWRLAVPSSASAGAGPASTAES